MVYLFVTPKGETPTYNDWLLLKVLICEFDNEPVAILKTIRSRYNIFNIIIISHCSCTVYCITKRRMKNVQKWLNTQNFKSVTLKLFKNKTLEVVSK